LVYQTDHLGGHSLYALAQGDKKKKMVFLRGTAKKILGLKCGIDGLKRKKRIRGNIPNSTDRATFSISANL
jgi:hypothetical protein